MRRLSLFARLLIVFLAAMLVCGGILPQTLADGPFYQLALCGHTHGGQVALLGHSLHSSSDLGDRYRSGWYREAGAEIMVSNGVGTPVLPVRLGAPPQYHLITLRKDGSHEKG